MVDLNLDRSLRGPSFSRGSRYAAKWAPCHNHGGPRHCLLFVETKTSSVAPLAAAASLARARSSARGLSGSTRGAVKRLPTRQTATTLHHRSASGVHGGHWA